MSTLWYVLADTAGSQLQTENGVTINTDYGKEGEAEVYGSAKVICEFHVLYPQVQTWFSHDEQCVRQ